MSNAVLTVRAVPVFEATLRYSPSPGPPVMTATQLAHSFVVHDFVASTRVVSAPVLLSAAPLSPLIHSVPALLSAGCVAPNSAPSYSKRCHLWRTSAPTRR